VKNGMRRKKINASVMGCIRDPCEAKIKILTRGELVGGGEEGVIYCELEKGHSGYHRATINWEGSD
jgi:Asp/Glu/hydantoin racemase